VAKIIGRSNQLFNQKLFIDAGKNLNLKENRIVVGTRGVIGRIISVGEYQSQLLLATDPSSRIPIIASKSRTRGILVGSGSGLMDILYLPKNHGIVAGELIFTSGDGDTLTSGLLIGMVKKVDQDSVKVALIENINNAEIVTVIDY
jgi:rod shape-determining protein MreC